MRSGKSEKVEKVDRKSSQLPPQQRRPASDRPPQMPAGPSGHPYLLKLQRLAGNAAVTGAVHAAPAAQRWVGPEHEELGDATGVKEIDLGNGVVLSWGQVVAVAGDEYGSVDQLRMDAETPEGRGRIRAALEHAGVADNRSLTKLPQPTPEQRSEHAQAYLLLTLENVEHFAAEGGAQDTWRNYHATAVTQALRAGLDNRPDQMQAAQLHEAFGQHFLTDAFSGGHIRTPRQAIITWYTETFAPRVADRFVTQLRARMVDGLFAQARPQVSGWIPDSMVRSSVESQVEERLQRGLERIGGHAGLVRWFGLALAGAVSGAMHDLENERAVLVASKAHPAPFQAYGDTLLDDPRNATNRGQASLAVRTAAEDLSLAYTAGEREGAASQITPSDLPQTVYFGFDSSLLSPAALGQVATAADYMARHPEAAVELTGHTDPVGRPAYNQALGQRRAESVASALTSRGAKATQVAAGSAGPDQVVASDPKEYRLNRRTVFSWRSDSTAAPADDQPFQRAAQALQTQVGPPYHRVEDLIPRPVEEAQAASANVPLEEWRWGAIPPSFVTRVDQWVRDKVAPEAPGLLAGDQFNDVTTTNWGITVTVHPRPVVEGVVKDLVANPMEFLGRAFGETATGK